MTFSQWSVWLANLDPIVGSEQGRTRPVLILSKTSLNRLLSRVSNSDISLPARFDRGVELCLRFGRNRIRTKRRHELFRGTVLRCRRFQSGRARCIVCQRLGDGISKALIRLIHCCGEQTRDRWCVTQRLSRIVGKTVVYPHLQTVACVSSQHHGVVVTISHRLVRYPSGNGLHLGGRC